ncbi:hypothetical protein E4T42_04783 [Aureobasidium subglaciale]|nr:hypothetical protein E4T42_04783 [Aureobasidium subglaciale]
MTVGELGFIKDERSVSERRELNMVFAGDNVDMDFGAVEQYGRGDFHPREIRQLTNMWQRVMPNVNG